MGRDTFGGEFSRFGDVPYAPLEGQDRIPRSRTLRQALFENRKRGSFQQKKYLYQIQVVTRVKGTDEEIFRMINVTERERSPLGEVEGAARDVIMDSPVSSREDFVRTELVGAFYHAGAPNID